MTFRIKAFLWHLSTSALLLSVFAGLVLWMWYAPWPLLSLQGGIKILALMILVDVVLGPSFTLLVANPKKSRRELMVDISVIVFAQLVAFGYGSWVLYSERPLFMALTDGRVEVVRAPDVDQNRVDKSVIGQGKGVGAQWVWVEIPKIMQFAQILNQITGSSGVELKPEYYRPLQSAKSNVLDKQALRIEDVKTNSELVAWSDDQGLTLDKLWVFPVNGRDKKGLVVLAKDTWEPLVLFVDK